MFILDRPKSETPTYIFIKKKLIDGPLKMSLGLKILPANWSKKTESCVIKGLDRDTLEDNKSFNATLKRIRDYYDERTREARFTGSHLTCKEFLGKINEILGRQLERASIFKEFDIILEKMASGEIVNDKGKLHSKGTLRGFKKVANILETFDPSLSYYTINMDFYQRFNKYSNDKNWSLNYFGHIIKLLKILLGVAESQGFHNCTGHHHKDFKSREEETDDVFLDQTEISNLYNIKVSAREEVVRDWFILDCFLGLRVCDLRMLSSVNISGRTVMIMNEKTDTKVVLPLHPMVKEILEKWKGLPPKVSEVEMRRVIKVCCERAAIVEPFIYSVTQGGVRVDYYYKKFEMISTHTARRSFITNMLESSIPDHLVMQLAGIKKYATLLRYKKTKPEKGAILAAEYDFFKNTAG